MDSLLTRARGFILVLALLLLLLFLALLSAGGRQVSLPLTGLQSSHQLMPPDPQDWCRKVNLERLAAEIAKAEAFYRQGVGESLVDWHYLRRALKFTGVQVNGPEDGYWLETIKKLYSDCGP